MVTGNITGRLLSGSLYQRNMVSGFLKWILINRLPYPLVIAGLVPSIPIREAQQCLPKRDGRDKPGHDELRESISAPEE